MICDILRLNVFGYYKSKPGPFLITFYYEDSDGTNFKIYNYLKKLESTYNDVPIIRFDFLDFKTTFDNIYIPSANHLMVIQANESNKFFKATDFVSVKRILDKIRRARLSLRKLNNKQFFFHKTSMKPWIINSTRKKVSEIMKFVALTAVDQYKFPNSTISIVKNNIIQKKNSDTLKINKVSSLNKNSKMSSSFKKKLKDNIESKSNKIYISDANLLKYPRKSTNPDIIKLDSQNINDSKLKPKKSIKDISIQSKILNIDLKLSETNHRSNESSKLDISTLPHRKRILKTFKWDNNISLNNTDYDCKSRKDNNVFDNLGKINFILENKHANDNLNINEFLNYNSQEYKDANTKEFCEINDKPLDLSKNKRKHF